MNENQYLKSLAKKLLSECQAETVLLSRAWASNFPPMPGVYVFKDRKKIIYVGETGNLRGRMKDMIDTRNHVLRRNIGNRLYLKVKGFEVATARKRFIDVIEDMLDNHIRENLTICYIIVKLGRKELEEKIQIDFNPEYNQKGLRKTF